jgi:hypothetical protein
LVGLVGLIDVFDSGYFIMFMKCGRYFLINFANSGYIFCVSSRFLSMYFSFTFSRLNVFQSVLELGSLSRTTVCAKLSSWIKDYISGLAFFFSSSFLLNDSVPLLNSCCIS